MEKVVRDDQSICDLLRGEILRRCLDRPDTLRGKKGLDLLWSAISSGCSDLLDLLQETGCDFNAPHVMGRTALMHAVEMNRPECVRRLLKLGADPLAGDYPPAKLAITLGDEETAVLLLNAAPPQNESQAEEFFYEALYKGRLEVARYFLDRGYPPNLPGTWDITPLLAAVMGGSAEVVQALVEKGAQINRQGSGGVTPLMKAIEFGHNDIARWLLDHGADPTHVSPEGASALTMLSSSMAEEDLDLVRRLLAAGDGASDALDYTPLMAAAAGKKSATLGLLLERPHDLERRDRHGMTALHHACQSGDTESIRLLVRDGADCNTRSGAGASPLALLLNGSGANFAAVEALLQGGADPTLPDEAGCFPSQLAAGMGEPSLVRLLQRFQPPVKAGPDLPWELHLQVAVLVEAVRSGRREDAGVALQSPLLTPPELVHTLSPALATVMFDAIRHDLIEVVRRLLEGGAPVGLVDGDRTTPLAMASRFSRMEIALLLLENGANLEAMTERGYTPLQMAGSGEMEQFLLSQGARPRE